MATLTPTSISRSAEAYRPGSGAAQIWLGAAAFALLASAALPVDLPLAAACRRGDLPGDVVRIVNLTEAFAHGAGVAMILLAAAALDPGQRRRLGRVAAAAYGAGLLANLAKMLVARARPSAYGDGAEILATFQAWLPWIPGRMAEWGHGNQGFPSGHAATAVGLALGLSAVYPRGRYVFACFAVLASLQRVVAGAHFLSDVLAGAALGFAAAALLGRGPLARRFERWETARQIPG